MHWLRSLLSPDYILNQERKAVSETKEPLLLVHLPFPRSRRFHVWVTPGRAERPPARRTEVSTFHPGTAPLLHVAQYDAGWHGCPRLSSRWADARREGPGSLKPQGRPRGLLVGGRAPGTCTGCGSHGSWDVPWPPRGAKVQLESRACHVPRVPGEDAGRC